MDTACGVPARVMVAESEDGLLLDTVQVYSPPVVTVRVCVYCAVTGSSNTVSVPSVTVMESLVQVTVVAGPPVEIQVRVIWSESNVTSPDIVTSPPLQFEMIVNSLLDKQTYTYHQLDTVPHRLCLSLRCQWDDGQQQLEYHSDRYQLVQ